MAKEVIHTIKLKGQVGYDLRLLLAEHYDVVASSHHSPDGETIFYDLDLFPKGSLQKSRKEKTKIKYSLISRA